MKITKNSKVRCETLHWYWDDCVLSRQNNSFEQWIALLTPNTTAQSVKKWSKKNPWLWADESYQVVTSPTFMYCVKNRNICQIPLGNKVTLAGDYQERFAPIINQRMVLASKRLATVLTASLNVQ
ncbi:S1/P1 nuclease [Psychrobium sp. nBUS_13]|uniref:S1/P1 nuclease n=1 Tax=Psychrobium sp. nBUS_13 TaxID=3395319 RepID=UPI003EB80FD8